MITCENEKNIAPTTPNVLDVKVVTDGSVSNE